MANDDGKKELSPGPNLPDRDEPKSLKTEAAAIKEMAFQATKKVIEKATDAAIAEVRSIIEDIFEEYDRKNTKPKGKGQDPP